MCKSKKGLVSKRGSFYDLDNLERHHDFYPEIEELTKDASRDLKDNLKDDLSDELADDLADELADDSSDLSDLANSSFLMP